MVVAVSIVIADQATKWAIVQWVPLYDRVPINSFINLTHQKNPGAAFSFLANAGGWQRWFFVVLSTGVSGFIVAWIWRIRKDGQVLLSISLALVLGGAVGNLDHYCVQLQICEMTQQAQEELLDRLRIEQIGRRKTGIGEVDDLDRTGILHLPYIATGASTSHLRGTDTFTGVHEPVD